jgi:hypothetical protein
VPCPLKAAMMDADEFWALIALLGGYSRPGAKVQLRAALAELQSEKLVGFTDQLALTAYATTGRALRNGPLVRNPHAQRNAFFGRMPARFRGALSRESPRRQLLVSPAPRGACGEPQRGGRRSPPPRTALR